MYHIPGCPFSERVELLLDLKGLSTIMADHEIDISKPRPDWLLRKTRGTTALPALELENGETLKESMVTTSKNKAQTLDDFLDES
eukprot:gene7668-10357_t